MLNLEPERYILLVTIAINLICVVAQLYALRKARQARDGYRKLTEQMDQAVTRLRQAEKKALDAEARRFPPPA